MLAAIKNFPTPKTITDIRSFFGLVNQISYVSANTNEMQPFRELLKEKQKFYWDEQLDMLFRKTIDTLIQEITNGIRTFELNRPICIRSDWSKYGLGFVLQQKYCHCNRESAPDCCPGGWKTVYAGSRFTSDAESPYAPIKGEALALEKCKMFVLGSSGFIVVVDHKPLVKIFNDKPLRVY